MKDETARKAEQAVLGAILIDGNALSQVRTGLRVADFHSEMNRLIYEAFLELNDTGSEITLLTTSEALGKKGKLDTAGGYSYLASLVDAVPTAVGVMSHAGFVKGYARRRRAADVGSMLREGAESNEDLDALISQAMKALEETLADGGDGEPIAVCVGDVEPEEVSWLWYPYIAYRKLTLLEGDPGLGKSWISLAIATSISSGKGLPGADPRSPGSVLICSAEDGIGDTIRPRLDAMEAYILRIHALARPLVFDGLGLAELEGEIRRIQPALIVVDPIMAYMGANVDVHRGNETRAVLAQLSEMAERHGMAILAIRHLRKSSADKAIYRGIGGIDFTAAARSVLLVGADPEDDKKRALIHIKSNLAPKGESLGYELGNDRFFWTGVSDLTAERVLSANRNSQDASSAEKAEAFLMELVAEGPVRVEDIKSKAETAGLSWRTVERAKKSLGIESDREGFGKGGEWFWKLPEDHTPPIDRHTPPNNPLAAYGDFGGVCERSGNGGAFDGETLDMQQAPCPKCGERAWRHLGGLDYVCENCQPEAAANP